MVKRTFVSSLFGDRALFVLTALVVFSWRGCDVMGSESLKVLSYNIHHGEGGDGKLDLVRIAAIISQSGADVVALQEVDRRTERTGGVDQAAELARLTGFNVFYGKAMDFQGGAYGQALLSRWPLDETRVHRLPNPSQREPRIAVSALVRPPHLKPFRVIGTHLDAGREDVDRWAQAGDLMDLFVGDSHPTLLVGDLNSRPDSRVVTFLLEKWTDASAQTPAYTVSAKKPSARIDYILYRSAPQWRVKSSVVLPEAVASDHRPLLVEFEASGP